MIRDWFLLIITHLLSQAFLRSSATLTHVILLTVSTGCEVDPIAIPAEAQRGRETYPVSHQMARGRAGL